MQDFGEHGREYISAELGLQLLQTLAKPELIKAVVGGGERGEKLMQLLQQVVFKVRGTGHSCAQQCSWCVCIWFKCFQHPHVVPFQQLQHNLALQFRSCHCHAELFPRQQAA